MMKINIIKKNSINIIVMSKLLCLFINQLTSCNFVCLFYIKKKDLNSKSFMRKNTEIICLGKMFL
jgi:hypothetical protein